MQNPRLQSSFDHDTEMWHIYDAERSVAMLNELGPERFQDRKSVV